MPDTPSLNANLSSPIGVAPVLPGSPSNELPIKPPGTAAEVRAMLQEWLGDTSGYDEQVWPELKSALERNRTSARRLFDG
jgi:hypothetical protein